MSTASSSANVETRGAAVLGRSGALSFFVGRGGTGGGNMSGDTVGGNGGVTMTGDTFVELLPPKLGTCIGPC